MQSVTFSILGFSWKRNRNSIGVGSKTFGTGHRKEQPATETGEVTSSEVREQEELAKTIRKGQRIEKGGKSLTAVDIPGTYQGRSLTNKARFSRLFQMLTGKKSE